MRQAIIWTNDGPVYWHMYASLGFNELKIPLPVFHNKTTRLCKIVCPPYNEWVVVQHTARQRDLHDASLNMHILDHVVSEYSNQHEARKSEFVEHVTDSKNTLLQYNCYDLVCLW